jgi:transcriptional regulator with GAF, ATPase, and Fis domain
MAGMAVVLRIHHGGASRTLRLQRELITLGRDPTNTIVIDDNALSRRHCQFEKLGSVLYVRDLQSSNGTRVDGEVVERARLEPGQAIEVGTARVVYAGMEPQASGIAGLKGLLKGSGRKRRRRDLEEENHKLRELLAITRQLVGELDQDRVLGKIIDTAIDLAGAERGFVLLFREEGLSVEIARNYWRRDIADPEFEFSRNIAEEVRRQRRTLIVEDASDDERFSAFLSVSALELRSVLCVPLQLRSAVIGVLYLDNRFDRASFGEEDTELIESFASLAAIALDNSGRFTEALRRGRVLEEDVAHKHRALAEARERLQSQDDARRLRYSYDSLVVRSPAMHRLVELTDRVIPTELTVLIEGPSGTEKEHLARIIHERGPRRDRPFVAVACAALPASLAEVELFGHGRGAYTGAGEARGGILAQAEGGTLFLDGLEDLEWETQALFLRVLESGEYRRVGESAARRSDVRVIGASGEELARAVEAGSFREDLYFRMKTLRLVLPPLAARPEDLPEILERVLAEDAPGLVLSPQARKALLLHSWPGNLVELRGEIRRLGTLGGDAIDGRDLAIGEPLRGGSLREAVAALERRLIVDALERSGGNRTRAAAALGLSRLGLRKKMERLEIA